MSRLKRDIKSYNEAVIKRDSTGIAEASYLMAKRHINLGNYAIAETWLQKALRIRKDLSDFEDIGKIYLRLQEIQFILENPLEALRNARLALINFRKGNSSKGIMSAYGALGTSHLLSWEKSTVKQKTRFRSSLHKAKANFRKSLELAQILHSTIDEGQMYRYLGICSRQENNIPESLSFKITAWKLDKKQGLLSNSIELAIDIANQYLQNKDHRSARPWLIKAKDLLGNSSFKPGLKTSLLYSLAEYHQQKKEWMQALEYRRELEELRESAFLQYRNEAVEGVRRNEEAKLKEVALTAKRKEVSLLKSNATLKNRMLYTVGLLLIISTIAAILYSKLSSKHNSLYLKYRTLSEYNAGLVKEQSHRTQNDLQLVSNLLSLQSHQSQDPAAAKLLEESLLRVESIILIHRRLYQDTMPMFVNVELYLGDLIQSVLRVYCMTYVTLSLDVKPFFLHVKKMAPLALILNELMTNSCKYAFTGPSSTLHVRCYVLSDKVNFLFHDNGPGFDMETVLNGFGLELIDLLAEQLEGQHKYRSVQGCRFELSFLADKTLIQLLNPNQTDLIYP
ncbi:sensor histidine kinase [Dyadobacter pollutisoli]|uniref:histidine kinase n=1 Tax=Dyadobacter pollutisoli TaxID=2910158 RepID=A0A9E8SLN8_9BACT|nr:sensor histidine kinase [Dyadobacter pollutisoli]WAC12404.1 sensor histidine kinase [Dyadobacter pollutisoli]